MPFHPTQIVIQSRAGCTSSSVIFWHKNVGPLLGLQSLVIGGRAQGHTEECRVQVEGELKKSDEGRVCFKVQLEESSICRRPS